MWGGVRKKIECHCRHTQNNLIEGQGIWIFILYRIAIGYSRQERYLFCDDSDKSHQNRHYEFGRERLQFPRRNPQRGTLGKINPALITYRVLLRLHSRSKVGRGLSCGSSVFRGVNMVGHAQVDCNTSVRKVRISRETSYISFKDVSIYKCKWIEWTYKAAWYTGAWIEFSYAVYWQHNRTLNFRRCRVEGWVWQRQTNNIHFYWIKITD